MPPSDPSDDATDRRSAMGTAALALFLSATVLVTPAAAAPRLPAPANAAAGGKSQRMLSLLDRRGDLTLRDSTLEAALFTISELWGINIVAGDVPGAVNGVFKDAPLREILDSILLSNGYAYRPVGESLVVSRLQDLGQINPFFVSATIPVGAAEVGEVVDAARLMSTPQGQVRAMPSAGAVLVVDFPDRVEKIRELIAQIDRSTRALGRTGGAGVGPQRLEVAYFRTHFVPAADAQLALNVVLSPQGRIAAIDNEDRLLVVDYAENLAMVETVLSRIDRARPQVKIQALIYDLNVSDIEEIGVNWNALTGGSAADDGTPDSGDGALINTLTKAPFDAAGTGGSFTFFSINADLDLQAVVLALQQADDSRLLASPNVTVVDNEEALFESVSEIPFQQLTQTGAGGQIGTTSFREAGISLTVRPKVANDRTIDLRVTPEFSRLTGFTPGDNQPIIDRRTATTRVRVANGQTLMIGGLRQRNDVGDFDGVPLLKDIRYLGHLFRARETRIEESELVVFITPEIIGYADPLPCRQQLAADTIHCRLDRIPAAEGCPPCGPCASGASDAAACDTCHSATEIPTLVVPHPHAAAHAAPPQPEPMLEPTLVMPTVAPAEPAGDPAPRLEAVSRPPQPRDPAPSAIDSPDNARTTLRYPLIAETPRRLPPAITIDDSITPVEIPGAGAAVARRAENPLRKGYDQRYRASGSLNAPRVAEQPEAPEGEPTRGRLPAVNGLFWR